MKIVIMLINLFVGLCCFAQGQAELTVYASVLSPHDTLELYVWDDMVAKPSKNPHRILKAPNAGGKFHFEISRLQDRSWINLGLSFQKLDGRPVHNILEGFLVKSGDSVDVYLSPRLGKIRSVSNGYDGGIPVLTENWNVRFDGKGAIKYTALWQALTSEHMENRNRILNRIGRTMTSTKLVLLYALQEESLKTLNTYKDNLPPDIYGVLEGQVRGKYGYEIGRTLDGLRFFSKTEQEKAMAQIELDRYLRLLGDDIIGQDLYCHSPHYIEYLVQYYWLAFTEQSEGKGGVGSWYRYCKENIEPSFLRDRVLTSLLMKRFQEAPQKEILEDALISIDDPYCLGLLEPLKHHLSGNEVFDFVLPDANGKYYSLKDFRGKVVFMDFWYAACTPCRKYMTEVVSPVKQRYKNNPNVVFVTVSTDRLDTFQKMLERQDFLPSEGIHLYTDNMRYSHPIIQYYQISAYPFPLLIGKDGRIVAGSSSLRDIERLSTAIQTALER